jgi:hypothetical protein
LQQQQLGQPQDSDEDFLPSKSSKATRKLQQQKRKGFSKRQRRVGKLDHHRSQQRLLDHVRLKLLLIFHKDFDDGITWSVQERKGKNDANYG